MKNPPMERIYVFVRDYWDRHRYAPSQREIAEGCRVSPSTVRRNLKKLETAGRIRRQRGHVRSLHLPRTET